jgi:hypothetical protein
MSAAGGANWSTHANSSPRRERQREGHRTRIPYNSRCGSGRRGSKGWGACCACTTGCSQGSGISGGGWRAGRQQSCRAEL